MNAACPKRPKSKFAPGCISSALALVLTASVASALPAIKVLRGANQETTYGSSFAAPLVVWVTDPATERGVSGLRVDFTPGEGIGLSSSYAITDEKGLASVTATGLSVCISEVSAEISGFTGAKVNVTGLTVDKATLTVIPADLSTKVGDAIPATTGYTITGFVQGDTEQSAQVTGSPVLTTTAKEHSPHANYAIKGNVGSLAAPNYTFVAGFGTLAILVGANSPDQPLEASVVLPAKQNVVEVHRALLTQIAAMPAADQAPIEARNTVATFVRPTVSPIPASGFGTAQSSQARSAMAAVAAAETRKAAAAPVRAVALPKATDNAAATRAADTRAALQFVVADIQKNPDTPVKSAVSVALATTAVTVQSPDAQPEIRKAFVRPESSN